MKKILLIMTVTLLTVTFSKAQTVWNFSNDPFGVNGAAGGSAAIDFTHNYATSDSLLVLGTDGSVNWTGLTTNSKTIDGISYTYRLQTGGGGSPVSPSLIPTTRYILFTVSGASTINIGMISSSSSSTRTLIIVNDDQSVKDSITSISGSSASTYTYNYSGKAGKVYLYSRSSGINYYYLSATNVIKTTLPFLPSLSTVRNVLADKGITFNGTEITNSQNLNIELYSVLGKRVATANTSISTSNLPKGVYIVRVKGSTDALKISL